MENVKAGIAQEMEFAMPITPDQITLRMYQKYLKLKESEQAKSDPMYFKTKVVQIFCDVSHEDVMKMQAALLDAVVYHLVSLIHVEDNAPLIERFTIEIDGEDVEFGFNPQLERMSIGEYIDLESYVKKDETAHKAMAVLFRPISKKWKDTYDIQPYTGSSAYSEVLLDMPAIIAVSAMVFFYRIGKKLPSLILTYLLSEEMNEELIRQYKQTLAKSGDGISALTSLHRGRHLEYLKQLSFHSTKP